jgi:hypothetical protein
MTNPIWIRTAVRAPRAEDATDGVVWTWTDPKGPYEQSCPYNSAKWQDVVEFPMVYPLWMHITKVIP